MIFLEEIGDVFAEDVVYHKKCMEKYLIKFEREIEALLAEDFGNKDETNIIKDTFKEVVATLNIDSNGYAISVVRDTLNKKLKNIDQGKLFIYWI